MKLKKTDIGAIVIVALFVICACVAMFKSCSYDKYAITYEKGNSAEGVSIIVNDTVVGKPTLEESNGTYIIKAKNKDIKSDEPLVLKSVKKIDD